MRKTSPQWGRILIVSGLVMAVAAGVHAHEVDDEKSGPEISQTFDLTGFDAIDISGVYDVEVEVGSEFSIRLEGPQREMDHVRVELDGNSLELAQKKAKWRWKNRKGVDAFITLPALNELDVSGVSDVNVKGVSSENFKLNVSGVADINVEGRCNYIEARISGVSDVDARALECQDAEVKMSGVGDLEIYTSASIDANVSGVGDVTVYGTPERVEKSVSKYTASLTIK